jgi:hypothetical protein
MKIKLNLEQLSALKNLGAGLLNLFLVSYAKTKTQYKC